MIKKTTESESIRASSSKVEKVRLNKMLKMIKSEINR